LFRLRKEKAEEGVGGFSAFSLRNQIVDDPAVLLVKSRTTQKSFLFLLEEKNRRSQIKNCEENFFAGWRGFRATAGLASLLGVLLKKCSNFVQNSPPKHITQEVKSAKEPDSLTKSIAALCPGRTKSKLDLESNHTQLSHLSGSQSLGC
jgi:hypothetical protein